MFYLLEQVLAVIGEIPNISALVNSLYDCRYRDFMYAVVELNGQLEDDRYFATHVRYLIRELRILGYTQFLDAYKSVVMATMAAAFGVGEAFLDTELSRFIAAGRLNAKIDKVRLGWDREAPGEKDGGGKGQDDFFLSSIGILICAGGPRGSVCVEG